MDMTLLETGAAKKRHSRSARDFDAPRLVSDKSEANAGAPNGGPKRKNFVERAVGRCARTMGLWPIPGIQAGIR